MTTASTQLRALEGEIVNIKPHLQPFATKRALHKAITIAKELEKERDESNMKLHVLSLAGDTLQEENATLKRRLDEAIKEINDSCLCGLVVRGWRANCPKHDKPATCPNCKEANAACACIRNTCIRCGLPVGNITFTICDTCWNKGRPSLTTALTPHHRD